MKTIQITKREQHVLMTVLRVMRDAVNHVSMKIDSDRAAAAMAEQPGMNTGIIPTVYELDSIIERLSSNEAT